uniref:U3 small nucleolar RNA-associated protein NOL7 C-terminal domain-containing protein n=1 Tax=Cynoglossus semilaevis TaxID=244447 RepID=A0A3P8X376_CYNSE
HTCTCKCVNTYELYCSKSFSITLTWLAVSLFVKKEAEMSSFSLNSSDDEAPEEVTFEESKSDALRCLKETLNTVRREKEQLKEKRRRRQELFQEQKVVFLFLSGFILEEDDWFYLTTSCFVSLKGNYKVATLKEDTAASYQQRAAQDFIQSRLYGPGSCRTTSEFLIGASCHRRV